VIRGKCGLGAFFEYGGNMKILFIGGDSDGEYAEWTGVVPPKELKRTVRSHAPTPREIFDMRKLNALEAIGNEVVQSYALVTLRDSDGQEYHFYFGGNPAQPIRMLFDGYGKKLED
jgi:hypothetical protein